MSLQRQGDACPCTATTSLPAPATTDRPPTAISEILGCKVIPLQTIPARDANGTPVINQASGWPDSDFYDIDLAIAILRWRLNKRAWWPGVQKPLSLQAKPLSAL